ncbi:MAG: hypothetical protein BA870_01795 [Desulfuromonadales bacterium C00003094]|jgi:hypothetical protein|nr:MAG: hypothetical protein BA870_01795 [Desulfuromonadales bacterium C00003094]OEU73590.1 MAG: hypothetical protein BA869_06690 [Desulfuromonadales bacterium C00003107]
MVGGFNHNFRYKGETFHIQTEDGGQKNPRIVTQLFRGGTVLGSQKQSYDELFGLVDLSQQVESRMQEQHKEMLRRLRSGEFDETIAALVASAPAQDSPSREQADTAEPEPQEAAELPIDIDDLVFAYLSGNDSRYQLH